MINPFLFKSCITCSTFFLNFSQEGSSPKGLSNVWIQQPLLPEETIYLVWAAIHETWLKLSKNILLDFLFPSAFDSKGHLELWVCFLNSHLSKIYCQRYHRPTKCFQATILQKKKDNTKSCEYALKLNHKMILVIWQHSYLQHRVDTKIKCQSLVNSTTANSWNRFWQWNGIWLLVVCKARIWKLPQTSKKNAEHLLNIYEVRTVHWIV